MGRSNDQLMELRLRDALKQYIEKGMIDELMCDMEWIFKDEEAKYDYRLQTCQRARRMICGEKK